MGIQVVRIRLTSAMVLWNEIDRTIRTADGEYHIGNLGGGVGGGLRLGLGEGLGLGEIHADQYLGNTVVALRALSTERLAIVRARQPNLFRNHVTTLS